MTRIVRVKLTPKNLSILHHLDAQCFPYDEPYIFTKGIWWIVYVDGWPAGYAGLKMNKNGRATFERAGVLKEFRGKGLHFALIKRRVSYAKKNKVRYITTYTIVNNYTSSNNLIKFGFRLYGYKDSGYKNRNFLHWKLKL